MRGTRLLRNLTLMAALGILGSRPVLANCDAAQENCSSSCSSMATSGFIVGMAGALNRNNSAYQSGQRDMQNAQACYNRCQAQYQSCSRQEQAAQQRQEAQRRAQQQQIEAQRQQVEAQQQRIEAERQAQQRALAEREALRQRVNRVVSPPVLPAPKIKDAAPLLLEAQAHDKDSNPAAAAYIYKLVLQGAEQPRHQQAARAALKRHALEELTDVGTRQPATYAMTLDAYEPLGVFSPAERAQLAAMAPDSESAENAARDYLRKNPKGALREVADAIAKAAPELRAREREQKQRAAQQKLREEDQDRLEQIRTVPTGEIRWVRAPGGCLINDAISRGTLDISWSGECKDGYADGNGVYQHLGPQGTVLWQFEGKMIGGKLCKLWPQTGPAECY